MELVHLHRPSYHRLLGQMKLYVAICLLVKKKLEGLLAVFAMMLLSKLGVVSRRNSHDAPLCCVVGCSVELTVSCGLRLITFDRWLGLKVTKHMAQVIDCRSILIAGQYQKFTTIER